MGYTKNSRRRQDPWTCKPSFIMNHPRQRKLNRSSDFKEQARGHSFPQERRVMSTVTLITMQSYSGHGPITVSVDALLDTQQKHKTGEVMKVIGPGSELLIQIPCEVPGFKHKHIRITVEDKDYDKNDISRVPPHDSFWLRCVTISISFCVVWLKQMHQEIYGLLDACARGTQFCSSVRC